MCKEHLLDKCLVNTFSLFMCEVLGFLDSSVGKESACNAEDPGLIS